MFLGISDALGVELFGGFVRCSDELTFGRRCASWPEGYLVSREIPGRALFVGGMVKTNALG